MPALTKPITMTVVAPELWIAAVPSAPIPTPNRRLPDALANSSLSLLLPAASRLELIVEQATRNTPMPASSVSTADKMDTWFICTSAIKANPLRIRGRKEGSLSQ